MSQVITFPDFGPLLTFKESIKSDTAIRKGIVNVPNSKQYANMIAIYRDFYAPVCLHFGRKLPVSSFFRSAELNKAIGGATTSAHLAGCAIDIDCDGIGKPSNIDVFNYIRANLKFDQLILEAPDENNNPSWIHVAHNRNGLPDRNQVMVMKRVKGKTIYQSI
ncbi:D-Ala-D-Ala carboxypeptidase family metallohydrolase [Spirosoma sp.]|uniref:D-Ala-D-Ala carboxypeptidase family metallohydrolase n=1 Tax=Spirosoma sp. TaxID=1899569 RepID=UPI002612DD65|nr:D-Ala-D-Ala carboxypeptidase family metallohydrolase [Spirosoma sp.]MCX6218322.1 D-Ala-D-Ala carboxypeptidase family metallohydrolase [Spirosoma sp.]